MTDGRRVPLALRDVWTISMQRTTKHANSTKTRHAHTLKQLGFSVGGDDRETMEKFGDPFPFVLATPVSRLPAAGLR